MLKRLFSVLLSLVFAGTQPAAPPAEEATLTAFFFNYNAMACPLFSGLEAKQTEDGWIARFFLYRGNDATDIPLTEEDVATLSRIVEEYALWSWDGFEKSDSSMLDGENFSFQARYSDGTQIDAYGNNCFPQGYPDAKCAILDAVEAMLIAHEIDYTLD